MWPGKWDPASVGPPVSRAVSDGLRLDWREARLGLGYIQGEVGQETSGYDDLGRSSRYTRRAAIQVGNKKLVKTAKFKCGRRGCDSADVRLYNGVTGDEAVMFMAGDRLPEGREETR